MAPTIFYADVRCPYLYGPDSDGFYWNLSGTTQYPVYQLGCYENVSLGDNLDVNSVRCDVVGDKDAIVKRNYLELKFTLKSYFPFQTISTFFGTDPSLVTTNVSQGTQKFGIGIFDNSKFYKVYMAKVYDEVAGDYVSITGHRCKIIPEGEWQMTYGQVWQRPVTIRFMADESKPTSQIYAVIIRADDSEIN